MPEHESNEIEIGSFEFEFHWTSMLLWLAPLLDARQVAKHTTNTLATSSRVHNENCSRLLVCCLCMCPYSLDLYSSASWAIIGISLLYVTSMVMFCLTSFTIYNLCIKPRKIAKKMEERNKYLEKERHKREFYERIKKHNLRFKNSHFNNHSHHNRHRRGSRNPRNPRLPHRGSQHQRIQSAIDLGTLSHDNNNEKNNKTEDELMRHFRNKTHNNRRKYSSNLKSDNGNSNRNNWNNSNNSNNLNKTQTRDNAVGESEHETNDNNNDNRTTDMEMVTIAGENNKRVVSEIDNSNIDGEKSGIPGANESIIDGGNGEIDDDNIHGGGGGGSGGGGGNVSSNHMSEVNSDVDTDLDGFGMSSKSHKTRKSTATVTFDEQKYVHNMNFIDANSNEYKYQNADIYDNETDVETNDNDNDRDREIRDRMGTNSTNTNTHTTMTHTQITNMIKDRNITNDNENENENDNDINENRTVKRQRSRPLHHMSVKSHSDSLDTDPEDVRQLSMQGFNFTSNETNQTIVTNGTRITHLENDVIHEIDEIYEIDEIHEIDQDNNDRHKLSQPSASRITNHNIDHNGMDGAAGHATNPNISNINSHGNNVSINSNNNNTNNSNNQDENGNQSGSGGHSPPSPQTPRTPHTSHTPRTPQTPQTPRSVHTTRPHTPQSKDSNITNVTNITTNTRIIIISHEQTNDNETYGEREQNEIFQGNQQHNSNDKEQKDEENKESKESKESREEKKNIDNNHTHPTTTPQNYKKHNDNNTSSNNETKQPQQDHKQTNINHSNPNLNSNYEWKNENENENENDIHHSNNDNMSNKNNNNNNNHKHNVGEVFNPTQYSTAESPMGENHYGTSHDDINIDFSMANKNGKKDRNGNENEKNENENKVDEIENVNNRTVGKMTDYVSLHSITTGTTRTLQTLASITTVGTMVHHDSDRTLHARQASNRSRSDIASLYGITSNSTTNVVVGRMTTQSSIIDIDFPDEIEENSKNEPTATVQSNNTNGNENNENIENNNDNHESEKTEKNVKNTRKNSGSKNRIVAKASESNNSRKNFGGWIKQTKEKNKDKDKDKNKGTNKNKNKKKRKKNKKDIDFQINSYYSKQHIESYTPPLILSASCIGSLVFGTLFIFTNTINHTLLLFVHGFDERYGCVERQWNVMFLLIHRLLFIHYFVIRLFFTFHGSYLKITKSQLKKWNLGIALSFCSCVAVFYSLVVQYNCDMKAFRISFPILLIQDQLWSVAILYLFIHKLSHLLKQNLISKFDESINSKLMMFGFGLSLLNDLNNNPNQYNPHPSMAANDHHAHLYASIQNSILFSMDNNRKKKQKRHKSHHHHHKRHHKHQNSVNLSNASSMGNLYHHKHNNSYGIDYSANSSVGIPMFKESRTERSDAGYGEHNKHSDHYRATSLHGNYSTQSTRSHMRQKNKNTNKKENRDDRENKDKVNKHHKNHVNSIHSLHSLRSVQSDPNDFITQLSTQSRDNINQNIALSVPTTPTNQHKSFVNKLLSKPQQPVAQTQPPSPQPPQPQMPDINDNHGNHHNRHGNGNQSDRDLLITGSENENENESNIDNESVNIGDSSANGSIKITDFATATQHQHHNNNHHHNNYRNIGPRFQYRQGYPPSHPPSPALSSTGTTAGAMSRGISEISVNTNGYAKLIKEHSLSVKRAYIRDSSALNTYNYGSFRIPKSKVGPGQAGNNGNNNNNNNSGGFNPSRGIHTHHHNHYMSLDSNVNSNVNTPHSNSPVDNSPTTPGTDLHSPAAKNELTPAPSTTTEKFTVGLVPSSVKFADMNVGNHKNGNIHSNGVSNNNSRDRTSTTTNPTNTNTATNPSSPNINSAKSIPGTGSFKPQLSLHYGKSSTTNNASSLAQSPFLGANHPSMNVTFGVSNDASTLGLLGRRGSNVSVVSNTSNMSFKSNFSAMTQMSKWTDNTEYTINNNATTPYVTNSTYSFVKIMGGGNGSNRNLHGFTTTTPVVNTNGNSNNSNNLNMQHGNDAFMDNVGSSVSMRNLHAKSEANIPPSIIEHDEEGNEESILKNTNFDEVLSPGDENENENDNNNDNDHRDNKQRNENNDIGVEGDVDDEDEDDVNTVRLNGHHKGTLTTDVDTNTEYAETEQNTCDRKSNNENENDNQTDGNLTANENDGINLDNTQASQNGRLQPIDTSSHINDKRNNNNNNHNRNFNNGHDLNHVNNNRHNEILIPTMGIHRSVKSMDSEYTFENDIDYRNMENEFDNVSAFGADQTEPSRNSNYTAVTLNTATNYHYGKNNSNHNPRHLSNHHHSKSHGNLPNATSLHQTQNSTNSMYLYQDTQDREREREHEEQSSRSGHGKQPNSLRVQLRHARSQQTVPLHSNEQSPYPDVELSRSKSGKHTPRHSLATLSGIQHKNVKELIGMFFENCVVCSVGFARWFANL